MTKINTSAVTVYVALGANLGDAIDTLLAACDALHQLPHTTDVTISGFYRTAPLDADGPDYINAVASLKTKLDPHTLLQHLFKIEHDHGRERQYPNAPRTLDMDLLLYGKQQIQTEDLIVPHPRMHLRAFVLQPLAELNPKLVLEQGSIQDLLAACADQFIEPLDSSDQDDLT